MLAEWQLPHGVLRQDSEALHLDGLDLQSLSSSIGRAGGRPVAKPDHGRYSSSSSLEIVQMNNAELADTLVNNHAMTKADARKAVDALLGAIVTAASKGDEVSFAGFGKFKVKDNPAREGRNPSNGETIQIAASKKLTFVPAKAVKDALNG